MENMLWLLRLPACISPREPWYGWVGSVPTKLAVDGLVRGAKRIIADDEHEAETLEEARQGFLERWNRLIKGLGGEGFEEEVMGIGTRRRGGILRWPSYRVRCMEETA